MVSIVLIVLGAATFDAGPTRAQDRTDAAAFAQQHFERGVTLYDRRELESALASFQSSSDLVPSPNSSLYIARCLRELERDVEAAAAYETTLRLVRMTSGGAERYAQTAGAARTELARIAGRIGRIVLSGDVGPSASMWIGERAIPVAAVGLPVVVSPGTVTVTIEDADARWEQSTEVAAGTEVHLALARPGHTSGEPPPPTPSVSDSPSSVGARPGGVLAGLIASSVVAAAGLAIAMGFGISADARFADLEAACGVAPCGPDRQGAIDEGRTWDVVANIGIAAAAIGAAAVVLFIIVLVTGDDDSSVTLDDNGVLNGRF